MDYLSRMIEYSDLLHGLEISGGEHLKVILEEPYSYLKRAKDTRVRISSDAFLSSEDRERMLEEINGYIEKVEGSIPKIKEDDRKDDGLGILLLLAMAALYIMKGDEHDFTSEALVAFGGELEKILGK